MTWSLIGGATCALIYESIVRWNAATFSMFLQQPPGNVAAPISRGGLRGDQISFLAAGAEYRGRVNGNTIEGTVQTAGKSDGWKATR